ncbi:MAG: hypothetical protein F6K58_24430 [Symploca sp. SIO2E9]|nr:hypothetical protein [Symploca sp. SIO2E9]
MGRWGDGEMGRNYSSGLTFILELKSVLLYPRENCYKKNFCPLPSAFLFDTRHQLSQSIDIFS